MKTLDSFMQRCTITSTSAAWLYFQREGESALRKADWSKALKHLRAALSFAEAMKRSDPRITITLDRLAECSTITRDYNSAVGYVNRSIDFKFRILGPYSAASLKDYKVLADLYERQYLWSDAAKVTRLIEKLEEKLLNLEARSRLETMHSSPILDSRDLQSKTLPPGRALWYSTTPTLSRA